MDRLLKALHPSFRLLNNRLSFLLSFPLLVLLFVISLGEIYHVDKFVYQESWRHLSFKVCYPCILLQGHLRSAVFWQGDKWSFSWSKSTDRAGSMQSCNLQLILSSSSSSTNEAFPLGMIASCKIAKGQSHSKC